MKRFGLVALGWTAIVLATVGGVSAAEGKPGDPAPDFSLQASDGKTYRLADFRGKQTVVIAWFPKAFTSGCTLECKAFAAKDSPLRAYDVAYFLASTDDVETNRRFAEAYGADYPILSDPEGEVARAYGVIDAQQRFPRRWTFFIGKDGRILAIDKQVRPATHPADVARKLEELGVPKKKG